MAVAGPRLLTGTPEQIRQNRETAKIGLSTCTCVAQFAEHGTLIRRSQAEIQL